MRLLNVETLELWEFNDSDRPPYAILSHTWDKNEVSLQALYSPEASKTAGYKKICRFCQQAAQNGFNWVWVDTCCIDKTSSAELSEAINSMYRWYSEADVCYVYMNDVNCLIDLNASSFQTSRWFTRGWTLQELIAPSQVVFYNRDWQELGTESSLCEMVANITGIHAKALLGELQSSCVAQKMSWASKRQTTRKEDQAYCLMGLFGVNMPLLYGEGDRAFMRLQGEILRYSRDHSIFAWYMSAYGRFEGSMSVLAPSPLGFRTCGQLEMYEPYGENQPYSSTNKGIQIQLRIQHSSIANIATAMLNCRNLSDPSFKCVGVTLIKDGEGVYHRYNDPRNNCGDPVDIQRADAPFFQRENCYLGTRSDTSLHFLDPIKGCIVWLRCLPSAGDFPIIDSFPKGWENWSCLKRKMHFDGSDLSVDSIVHLVFANKWANENFIVALTITRSSVVLLGVEVVIGGVNPFQPFIDTTRMGDLISIRIRHDRVTKELPSRATVNVALVRGVKDGRSGYFLDVRAQRGITTLSAPGTVPSVSQHSLLRDDTPNPKTIQYLPRSTTPRT